MSIEITTNLLTNCRDYLVSMNYAASVEKLLKLGKFDGDRNDLAIDSRRFPEKRKHKTELTMTLFNADGYRRTGDVRGEVEERGCRLADLRELLSFWAQYPNILKEYNRRGEIVKELRNNNCSPAELEHILSFWAKNPETKNGSRILALGSVEVSFSGHGVPCIDVSADNQRKYVDLDFCIGNEGHWDDSYYFAAVRR